MSKIEENRERNMMANINFTLQQSRLINNIKMKDMHRWNIFHRSFCFILVFFPCYSLTFQRLMIGFPTIMDRLWEIRDESKRRKISRNQDKISRINCEYYTTLFLK